MSVVPSVVLGDEVLRAFSPEDMSFAFHLATNDPQAWRWRYRGAIPTPSDFERNFYADVASAFVVVNASNEEPLGIALIYSLNMRDQHAYLAVQLRTNDDTVGRGVATTYLLARYAFRCWPLRHLYFEVPEYNLPQFGSAIGSLLTRVGILPEYVYHDGRFFDFHILRLDRATLDRLEQPATARGSFKEWFREVRPEITNLDERIDLDSLEVVELVDLLSLARDTEIVLEAVQQLQTWRHVAEMWEDRS